MLKMGIKKMRGVAEVNGDNKDKAENEDKKDEGELQR